ncbi:sodium:alanine symporter family protein [Corynebacterium sp. HS2168-gen11]|uniref:alanine/glycine:cation symporter family protein n=1 Tax=Corynebacterium sp. HS2168-gen11 TaxID=2974027 RepID=UPI00216B2261|nr:alanine/glycine:cation symporter family protein [Corynebacterium sp. HS2168-gen11]MCS4535949.1 alanine:cation symporter family protein [Corynebacterium sp. HS2168-gen11]
MADIIHTFTSIIWSPALVFLCLAAGVYFTLATGFLQIRCIPDMLRQLRDGEKSDNGVSSFESLMISLAGRVGVGNIAGVATAIAFGGPGAVFWMWVVALLGSATSFVECTLAQIYKEQDRDTGEYRGGPAYYIEKAYRHTKAGPFMKVYGIVFAVAMVLATSYFLPGIQANGVAAAVENAWNVDVRITGVVLSIVLAAIVIGGIKRIANFASMIVPFMAVLYIIAAIVILIVHYDRVDDVFLLIFRSAFDMESAFSGMLGVAIMWGVKRGIYSNEAGQGTGPQSAAAAEVSHPAKQGFVQAFAVYIDTLFVCSATAFIIISTDMYKVFAGESETGAVLYAGSLDADVAVGPGFVQAGLNTVAAGIGPSFVALAILLFAFTTIIAYYYMAETNLAYFNRWIHNRTARRAVIWGLRVLIIISVLVGATTTPGTAWALGDIGVGMTAWLNILAILFLQIPAHKALRDYQRQKRAGEDPVFDPVALGIRNAEFWETYATRHREQEL